MTNFEMWTLIVGFLMPLVVATVQQPQWPNWLRATVMGVSSVIAGAITAYLQNGKDWNTHNVITAILTVGVAAIATYHGFWKPTDIAPKIEAKTTNAVQPPPAPTPPQ